MRTRAKRKKRFGIYLFTHRKGWSRDRVGRVETATATSTEWIVRSYIFKRVGRKGGPNSGRKKRETF